MRRWCDWVDEQLAAPADDTCSSTATSTLTTSSGTHRSFDGSLVADFETSGVADFEYDFRAIPSFGPGIDLLVSTIDEYVALTAQQLSLEHIMALHLRTSLRDALLAHRGGPAPAALASRRRHTRSLR